MGQAEIVKDIGQGLYLVRLLADTTAIDAEVNRTDTILAAIEMQLETETDPATIAALNARAITLKLRRQRLQKARASERVTTVWCADYSEGLGGVVGTIEPAREDRLGVNIIPGYADMAAYNPARDGVTVPFIGLPLMAAMYNYAIFPGAVKWRPRYRYATISRLDKDEGTCDVTFDATLSICQQLDVNQTPRASDVPIEYMECDGWAFENGDHVVVRFSGADWSAPMVIGFAEHPRPCYARYLRVRTGAGVLLYDIPGRRAANPDDLPDGAAAPDGPAAYTADLNAWLAAHVSVAAVNVDLVSLGGGDFYNDFYIGTWYVDVTAQCHIDLCCCETSCFTGTLTPCSCSVDSEFPPNPKPPTTTDWSDIRSHTGATIADTFGHSWAVAAMSCRWVDETHFSTWRRMESFMSVVTLDDLSRIVEYSGGDRGFIVTAYCEGEEDAVNTVYMEAGCTTQNTQTDLHFHSPFERQPVHHSPTLQNMGANPGVITIVGEGVDAVYGYHIYLGAKHSNEDMVGWCAFEYDIEHEASGGTKTYSTPDDIPDIRFYTRPGIDPLDLHNPFDCDYDPVLSELVRELVVDISGGLGSGLWVDFVDIG
jgi:hypothetical protein